MTPEYQWYAVYTKPRWEKKVAALLEEEGTEYYCPLAKVTRQWSDRVKVVVEPVFRGYVFVRLHKKKIWDVTKVSGVLTLVKYLKKPAIIRDDEITTIRKFLHEFADVKVEHQKLTENAHVRVRQGVMMDYEGIVLKIQGSRAVVRIESLGLQLSAHFNKNNLEKI